MNRFFALSLAVLAASFQAFASGPYAEEGYWKVRQDSDGYWTFVDPRGNDVFLRGVEQVVWRGHSTRDGKKPPYRLWNETHYKTKSEWADETVDRLKKWGFNTLGSWSDPSLRGRGMGYFVHVGFSMPCFADGEKGDGDLMIKRKSGRHFPNVFSPGWERHCRKLAKSRLILSVLGDSDLIGIYLDGELPWWGDNGNPDRAVNLCDVIMRQNEGHSARKALEEFAASRPGGLTRDAKLEFMKIIAERYYKTTTEAVRSVARNHLIVGSMFAGLNGFGPYSTLEACAKYCDVVSIDIYPSVDLDKGVIFTKGTDHADNAGDAPQVELFAELDRLSKKLGKPFHVTEWSFPAVEKGFEGTSGGGQRFRTQKERTCASQMFVEMLSASPSICGYNYFMWTDTQKKPIASQDCQYGLVNERGEPYRELVEMFAKVQPNLDSVRKNGYPKAKRWVEPPGKPLTAEEFAGGKVSVKPLERVKFVAKIRAKGSAKWEWCSAFLKENKNGVFSVDFPCARGLAKFVLRAWEKESTGETALEIVSLENTAKTDIEMISLFFRFELPEPLQTKMRGMPPAWTMWRPWVNLDYPWGEGKALRVRTPDNTTYGETNDQPGKELLPPQIMYVTSANGREKWSLGEPVVVGPGSTWKPSNVAYYILKEVSTK